MEHRIGCHIYCSKCEELVTIITGSEDIQEWELECFHCGNKVKISVVDSVTNEGDKAVLAIKNPRKKE